nr:hypothetical protein CFP56_73010 [Quercus suber]
MSRCCIAIGKTVPSETPDMVLWMTGTVRCATRQAEPWHSSRPDVAEFCICSLVNARTCDPPSPTVLADWNADQWNQASTVCEISEMRILPYAAKSNRIEIRLRNTQL